MHIILLSELGEPVKLAQAISGPADTDTTLGTYAHSVRSRSGEVEERLAQVVLDLNGPKSKEQEKAEPKQVVWIN